MTDDTGTLVPFNYGDAQVRVVTIDGEPWLVASDIARSLEYRDANALTRGLDADEKGTQIVRTPGGDQAVTVISESGFYTAALRSRSERATDFRRWVTREVLPSIRKTGGYGTAPALPADRTELLAIAVLEATTALEEKDEQIAALAPKAEYVDTYVADEDHLTFRTVASTLDIGEHDLRELLIDKGWIYRETTTRWSNRQEKVVPVNRYCEYAHKKPHFYRSLNHDAPRFRGEVMHTLKITAPGAQAVARLVKRGEDGPDLQAVSA